MAYSTGCFRTVTEQDNWIRQLNLSTIFFFMLDGFLLGLLNLIELMGWRCILLGVSEQFPSDLIGLSNLILCKFLFFPNYNNHNKVALPSYYDQMMVYFTGCFYGIFRTTWLGSATKNSAIDCVCSFYW